MYENQSAFGWVLVDLEVSMMQDLWKGPNGEYVALTKVEAATHPKSLVNGFPMCGPGMVWVPSSFGTFLGLTKRVPLPVVAWIASLC